MRSTCIRQRLSVLLLAILFVLSGSRIAAAQGEQNTIRIEAGQMIEIGTDTASPHPDFSWILTKDHAFQSAQRTRFFQTRLTQLGTYILDVSITDPAVNQNEYRAFTIVVTEPGAVTVPPPPEDGATKAVLTTDPPAINGTVYVPPDGGIVMIDASHSSGKSTSYALDLNSTIDADGDGNAQNDRDNRDTFSETSGSQIRYFLLSGSSPRSIGLTVTNAATGQTDHTSLNIAFAAPPAGTAQQATGGQNTDIVINGENMTASFSTQLQGTLLTGKQVLYEWDFGDLSRSLLFSPSHTYAQPGTYTVTLTVRDIANGQVLFTGTNSVQVFGMGASSSSSAGNRTSSASGTSGRSALPIGSIMKVGTIILLLLAFAIGLYFLFTWIKRMTAGSLEKTLETMEKNIVKTGAKPIVDVKVEPLKIKKEVSGPVAQTAKREDIADREKAKTEFRSQTRDNITPITAAGPVPSWLAKASATPEALPPVATPKPAMQPAPASTPVPNPNPAPFAPKPSPPPAPTTPVPDWLKQTPKPNPAPLPAPAPAMPKPAIPPATPTPNPNPAPPTAPPSEQKKPDDDETIAVIRADSLSK